MRSDDDQLCGHPGLHPHSCQRPGPLHGVHQRIGRLPPRPDTGEIDGMAKRSHGLAEWVVVVAAHLRTEHGEDTSALTEVAASTGDWNRGVTGAEVALVE